MTPFFSAVCWISGYLALVLAPLFVLIFSPVPSGSGFWWDFSMALGFSAMAIISVLFLLTARFRRASAPFGIDIIYYFHRYLAIIAFVLIFLHYIIIRINHVDALGILDPALAPWHMTSGRISLLLFTIIIITSLWRKPLHIDYDKWHVLHIGLALSIFLLALGHIKGVGYYIDAPAKRWLWSGYTLIWVLLVLYVRLVKPWGMRKRPYRVAQVREECCKCWTLALEPEGHAGIQFKPGQFAWLTLRESPWLVKQHPFSFSSSALCQNRVEFTIKELGDFSRTIKDIKVGEIAYLDGPYGIFSVDQYPDAKGFVFIAGGVGAAPIMSMLRTLADRHNTRPIWFIYGNHGRKNVIFAQELQDLKKRLDLHLMHVLTEPPPDWDGESGTITTELLQKTLPAHTQTYEYFLCGPKPMSDAVLHGLQVMRVPLGQVHFELFDMV